MWTDTEGKEVMVVKDGIVEGVDSVLKQTERR